MSCGRPEFGSSAQFTFLCFISITINILITHQNSVNLPHQISGKCHQYQLATNCNSQLTISTDKKSDLFSYFRTSPMPDTPSFCLQWFSYAKQTVFIHVGFTESQWSLSPGKVRSRVLIGVHAMWHATWPPSTRSNCRWCDQVLFSWPTVLRVLFSRSTGTDAHWTICQIIWPDDCPS